jgi:hypothetical protein
MEMNDNHKRAKLDVLKALRQVAMDLIKEKSEEGEEGEMPGMPEHMQKVSVMAKDPSDLAKGLDLAKQVAGKMPEVSEDEESEDPSQQALEDLTGTEIPGGSEEDEEALLLKKLEAIRSKKKMLA